MNCFNHPDTPAAAFCRSCGRPLCPLCQRVADGVIYCSEHAPVSATSAAAPPPPPPGAWTAAPLGTAPAAPDSGNPYVAPPAAVPVPPFPGPSVSAGSPGLAFVLGLIPGVGAIYNGQYVKGLVHAAIFGMLVTMSTHASGQAPIIGMSIAAFYFYMPFEAFHTARKRQMGIPVEEWSSLMAHKPPTFAVPIGPIILILIGVVFLLNSLNVLDVETMMRFWPVLLIVAGFMMLVARLRGPRTSAQATAKFDSSAIPETARER